MNICSILKEQAHIGIKLHFRFTAKRWAITKAEKRIEELDRLFTSIYEDKVSGALPEARFKKLSDNYEREQEDLRKSIITLTAEVKQQEE